VWYHGNMKTCKNPECQTVLEEPTRNKFCGRSCAASYNNSHRSVSQETKSKIARGVTAYYAEHKVSEAAMAKQRELKAKPTSNRHKLKSVCEVSSRTTSKIVNRIGLGCSRCGWNEAACDIHHICGRDIPDADNHSNLSLLCPNCHRMIHSGLICPEELMPLSEQWPDNWRDFYYG